MFATTTETKTDHHGVDVSLEHLGQLGDIVFVFVSVFLIAYL